MTHSGELLGDRPTACPFVALELDRDRRSDKPDYRHRCFAEPTPQPRAIAHQEAYCLSANFPSCPIFQGWAMRAAAEPVPAPAATGEANAGLSSAEAGAAAAAAAIGEAASPAPEPSPPAQPVQQVLPADVAPVVPAPGEAWPSDAFSAAEPDDVPRQMAAFDAPVTPPPIPPALPPLEPVASEAHQDAPVPGFLAGRSDRTPAPRSSRPAVQFREKVTREDVVPSWDLTDRYGADMRDERVSRGGGGGGGGDRFGGLITAIAVVAILALGVAGVLFLPGLLAGGGHAPTPTAPLFTASPTLPGDSPSLPPTPSGEASVLPTGSPTAAPSPTATPHLYRIKPGDQLTKIAKRFHVTVAAILAANPQITNQDQIQAGQVIVIPPRTPTATPSATP